jgi:hypothetical protein
VRTPKEPVILATIVSGLEGRPPPILDHVLDSVLDSTHGWLVQ